MKQIQFAFREDRELSGELNKIKKWIRNSLCSGVLIQLYTEILDRNRIEKVCSEISAAIPEAVVAGCSTNGNILYGDFSGGSFVAVCTFFEYPSSKVEVLQYAISAETQGEVTARLREEVAKRPWVKGIELLITIRGMSMSAFCDGLSELPDGIQVFGGGAFCENLEQNEACVFSSAGGYQEKSAVFILFGGDELHIETSFLTGWKPLGSFLHVTATDGAILKELNHKPAYDTYYKYLHIQNDENFFFNTLEFPFLYRYNGIDVLRAPTASNPDGSLTMTADINQGVEARIAYGDPWTILESAWQEGDRLQPFSPECIFVFSCAARRTFWGNSEVGKETEPYQNIAPTSGFYTSGEFLRTGKYVNQHNVTQVIAALREGEAKQRADTRSVRDVHKFEGKVSMINRMATFIKATTEELEAANQKLEEANRQLSKLAVTDALTGIGNKSAYFERIREIDGKIGAEELAFAAAVFDMNGLKSINDNYGHERGDAAIKDMTNALIQAFGRENLYRIGGDEFIAVLEGETATEMDRLFAELDDLIEGENETEKSYQTPLSLSKGYAAYDRKTDREYLDVFRRADEAMYQDKAAYYRTHDRRGRR